MREGAKAASRVFMKKQNAGFNRGGASQAEPHGRDRRIQVDRLYVPAPHTDSWTGRADASAARLANHVRGMVVPSLSLGAPPLSG